jgi:hypothetical protein
MHGFDVLAKCSSRSIEADFLRSGIRVECARWHIQRHSSSLRDVSGRSTATITGVQCAKHARRDVALRIVQSCRRQRRHSASATVRHRSRICMRHRGSHASKFVRHAQNYDEACHLGLMTKHMCKSRSSCGAAFS